MLIKTFPVPSRIDYVPSPYKPDDDGVMDIGYLKGFLSDGRAYRLECWRMDDMLMATVMFSNVGLEGYCREDMALLLEHEGIIRFIQGRPRLQCAMNADDAGHPVWSLNIMLANSKGTYAETAGELRRYIM